MKKYHERFGLIWGIIFFGFSILMTISFVLPLPLVFISEGLGTMASRIFNTDSIGRTTFYVCVLILIFTSVIYAVGYFKSNNFKLLDRLLIIAFVSIMIFLNSAIFYSDWLSPVFRMDGQQAFNIVDKPLKTSWIYPILGFLHYLKFKVVR